MKKGKIVALMFAALLTLGTLISCGRGASDETLLTTLETLAPKAKELYEIVYGDGLAHGDEQSDGYCQVSSTAAYRSISELKAALRTVFSSEYATVLENTAFNGVSSDEGAISAKFVERSGVLFVNPSVTQDFSAPRTFDLTKATVKKKNPYMAILLLPHEDGDLEVTLRNSDGVWLIDSPLF